MLPGIVLWMYRQHRLKNFDHLGLCNIDSLDTLRLCVERVAVCAESSDNESSSNKSSQQEVKEAPFIIAVQNPFNLWLSGEARQTQEQIIDYCEANGIVYMGKFHLSYFFLLL